LKRLLLAAVLALAATSGHADDRLLVFAAASLKNALDEAVASYGKKVVASYGASSTLARQIENGAPADVFISADLEWMDWLEKKGLLAPGTRRDLLGNRLVLVSPAANPSRLEPAAGFPLAKALGSGRLALADPNSVPAGKYAKAALQKLGVWNEVAGRLAPADNVRTALAFVARGEAPLGIVYATDAREEPRVVVAGVFPESTHPPIVYPAAVLRGARPGARELLDFLASPRARAIFGKHGFALH
jgi:molybdate transport system substrate-binding protein